MSAKAATAHSSRPRGREPGRRFVAGGSSDGALVVIVTMTGTAPAFCAIGNAGLKRQAASNGSPVQERFTTPGYCPPAPGARGIIVCVDIPGALTVPLAGLAVPKVKSPAIVNVTALLVPAGVVTVTFCAPVGAFAAIINVAVTCVAVATTLLTVIPLMALIEAPDRLVPEKVTLLIVAPNIPPVGLIEVSAGTGTTMLALRLKITLPPKPSKLATIKK